LKRIAASLLIGYAVGALIVIIFDRLYEGGWRGGFAILWLSLPTTIVYFLALWGGDAPLFYQEPAALDPAESSRAERGISQSKLGSRKLTSVIHELMRDPSLRSG
jgi:MFS family permease